MPHGVYKRPPAKGVKRYGGRKQINVLLDEDTIAEVRQFTETQGFLSMAEAIRHLIEWGLETARES